MGNNLTHKHLENFVLGSPNCSSKNPFESTSTQKCPTASVFPGRKGKPFWAYPFLLGDYCGVRVQIHTRIIYDLGKVVALQLSTLTSVRS